MGIPELKLSVLRAHRVPSGPRQSATGSRPPSGRFRNQQRDDPNRVVIENGGSHPRIPFGSTLVQVVIITHGFVPDFCSRPRGCITRAQRNYKGVQKHIGGLRRVHWSEENEIRLAKSSSGTCTWLIFGGLACNKKCMRPVGWYSDMFT